MLRVLLIHIYLLVLLNSYTHADDCDNIEMIEIEIENCSKQGGYIYLLLNVYLLQGNTYKFF